MRSQPRIKDRGGDFKLRSYNSFEFKILYSPVNINTAIISYNLKKDIKAVGTFHYGLYLSRQVSFQIIVLYICWIDTHPHL